MKVCPSAIRKLSPFINAGIRIMWRVINYIEYMPIFPKFCLKVENDVSRSKVELVVEMIVGGSL